jgi:3-deoxy-7-phosphoheptulonate synthase
MPIPQDDLRIHEMSPLDTPSQIRREYPAPDNVIATIKKSRHAVHDILHGHDDRLLVVIGPCSIHDPRAALEYANRLAEERAICGDALEIVMRVYFEKPRTTIGWKGLINDPFLDGSFQINRGLRLARKLLVEINDLGLPAGCEFLDTATPQYIADLVSWGAIGARTTESQVHRQLASGLSCAIGFKNGTNGDVSIAVDAMKAALNPHHFLAVTQHGRTAIAATTGNDDCHIILRGGAVPNYDAGSVKSAGDRMCEFGLAPRIMIDASHANSGKNPARQPLVVTDVAAQIVAGDRRIIGVMIESNLVGGRQDLMTGGKMTYGQSITDGCLSWEESKKMLQLLADAVRDRRRSQIAA